MGERNIVKQKEREDNRGKKGEEGGEKDREYNKKRKVQGKKEKFGKERGTVGGGGRGVKRRRVGQCETVRGRKGQKGQGDEEFGREQERGRKGNSGKNRAHILKAT